jgi:hypothetical protein
MDAIKGGVMTVTRDAFEIRTSSGNMIKGTLRLNASVRPMQMDLVHATAACGRPSTKLAPTRFG